MVRDLINTVKSVYKDFIDEIEDKSKTYISQKQRIEKLEQENRVLRKYLFDLSNYLNQLKSVHDSIPSLIDQPYKSMTLVKTVSYVKLNKFDQVLLNSSKLYELKEGVIYGLIQKEVVGGVAKIEDGHLYGYLISNQKCSFGVCIGKDRYPGVAFGNRETVKVKFIPKWAKIKVGDYVETSGLDKIFFANVPVGVVKSISVEESYQVATVKFFADVQHPDLFFLILDAKPYLTSYYDKDTTFPGQNYTYDNQPPLYDDKNIRSVPIINQAKYMNFNSSKFEIPEDKSTTSKIIVPALKMGRSRTDSRTKPKKRRIRTKIKLKPRQKVRTKKHKLDLRPKSKSKLKLKPKKHKLDLKSKLKSKLKPKPKSKPKSKKYKLDLKPKPKPKSKLKPKLKQKSKPKFKSKPRPKPKRPKIKRNRATPPIPIEPPALPTQENKKPNRLPSPFDILRV